MGGSGGSGTWGETPTNERDRCRGEALAMGKMLRITSQDLLPRLQELGAFLGQSQQDYNEVV
jgi:hypothetical protein